MNTSFYSVLFQFEGDSIEMRAWPWLEAPCCHTDAIVQQQGHKNTKWWDDARHLGRNRNVSLEVKSNPFFSIIQVNKGW